MKALLISLLLLVVLALAGDAFARSYAERRAAGQVQSSLELDDEPAVELEGWPFLLKALGGSFPSVSVEAPSLRARGVRLEDVDVTLEDVRFELKDLLAGSADGVRAESGRGSAALTSDALGTVAVRQGFEGDVALENGRVLVSVPQLPGEEAQGELALDGNHLTVVAEGLPQPIEIELPGIIRGLTYESVTIEGDRAVLAFTLTDAFLAPPD